MTAMRHLPPTHYTKYTCIALTLLTVIFLQFGPLLPAELHLLLPLQGLPLLLRPDRGGRHGRQHRLGRRGRGGRHLGHPVQTRQGEVRHLVIRQLRVLANKERLHF